jgi:general secretion pathway protein C
VQRIVTIGDRYRALTPRERVFVSIGGAILLLFLLWLLFLRGNAGDQPVELADSPPAPASAALPPAQPYVPPPMAPVPAAAAAPDATSSLVLQGVSGGGPGGGAALVQYANGNQRLIRVGREIVPGMMLRSVGLSWAIASLGGSDVRLDLNRPGATPVAAAAPVSPTVAAPDARAEQRETMEFRLGLQPRSVGGRTSGYQVKPGATPGRLAEAGILPGDIITRVNGSELDEERLLELSAQMTNAERTEFDLVRNGKPLRVTLPGSAAR